MALIIKSKEPKELLSKIKKAIDSNNIATWSYDSDGDFTHVPEQWRTKAWLSPKFVNEELHFSFIGNKKENTTKLVYALYHGRFAEMLLTHFDTDISNIEITSMPTSIDRIITNVTNS